jgi:hypothetical protein
MRCATRQAGAAGRAGRSRRHRRASRHPPLQHRPRPADQPPLRRASALALRIQLGDSRLRLPQLLGELEDRGREARARQSRSATDIRCWPLRTRRSAGRRRGLGCRPGRWGMDPADHGCRPRRTSDRGLDRTLLLLAGVRPVAAGLALFLRLGARPPPEPPLQPRRWRLRTPADRARIDQDVGQPDRALVGPLRPQPRRPTGGGVRGLPVRGRGALLALAAGRDDAARRRPLRDLDATAVSRSMSLSGTSGPAPGAAGARSRG